MNVVDGMEFLLDKLKRRPAPTSRNKCQLGLCLESWTKSKSATVGTAATAAPGCGRRPKGLQGADERALRLQKVVEVYQKYKGLRFGGSSQRNDCGRIRYRHGYVGEGGALGRVAAPRD